MTEISGPSSSEQDRLDALHEYEVLDTPPESAFDDLTQLASRICDVPIALVSLVDADRQWFKSEIGICAKGTDREVAFCNYTIMSDEIFEVTNAHEDPVFRDNPLVTGPPHIAYYCGVPIIARAHRIGAFCILDHQPREPLDERGRRILQGMAEQVGREVENRRVLREAMTQLVAAELL